VGEPTAGSSWTRCTRTSRSTRTRAASRAAGGRRRVPDRHLVRVSRATTKKSGAPIDSSFPKEGLGWDLEASAS
jgi:hypothetical protein